VPLYIGTQDAKLLSGFIAQCALVPYLN